MQNITRAIIKYRVIKLGLVAQLIDALQIAQKNSLSRVWRNLKGK